MNNFDLFMAGVTSFGHIDSEHCDCYEHNAV